MLEAVGQKYYGTFFNKCNNLLKPNGKLILQVITIPDQRFQSYKKNPDWIQKHIFPGGILPSLYELTKAIKNSSELQIDQINNIGILYSKTLHQWRFNFNQNDIDDSTGKSNILLPFNATNSTTVNNPEIFFSFLLIKFATQSTVPPVASKSSTIVYELYFFKDFF